MGNMIMAFMIALFAYQGFAISFKVSSFNKTILNTPKNIFLTSIPIVDEESENAILYFDKKLLENQLIEYYDDNLNNIVNSYELQLSYYNSKDQLMCKGDKCDGVKVCVIGYVLINMKITQKMYYEVQANI